MLSAVTIGYAISIHTPAWGVTDDIAKKLELMIISIHTPAWGVTIRITPEPVTHHNFNPHARVGRDERERELNERESDFNPHARVGRDL